MSKLGAVAFRKYATPMRSLGPTAIAIGVLSMVVESRITIPSAPGPPSGLPPSILFGSPPTGVQAPAPSINRRQISSRKPLGNGRWDIIGLYLRSHRQIPLAQRRF